MTSPFAESLRRLRRERHLRQRDLARTLSVDQSYVSALETGTKGPPSAHFTERLAETLELSAEETEELKGALRTSERKFELDADAPQDVYRLLHDLRTYARRLTHLQIETIRNVMAMCQPEFLGGACQPRRAILHRSTGKRAGTGCPACTEFEQR